MTDDGYDEVTIASSTIQTVNSDQIETWFPSQYKSSDFHHNIVLLNFLNKSVGLTKNIIVKLTKIGLTTPSKVANAFGLSDKTVSNSFLQLGYKYVGHENTIEAKACLKLFMFGRAMILKKKMLSDSEEINWNTYKKGSIFDKQFKTLTTQQQPPYHRFINSKYIKYYFTVYFGQQQLCSITEEKLYMMNI